MEQSREMGCVSHLTAKIIGTQKRARGAVKAGDLVRFKHDGQLMLITSIQRPGVFNGVFVTGRRHGQGITSYESLMEQTNESR